MDPFSLVLLFATTKCRAGRLAEEFEESQAAAVSHFNLLESNITGALDAIAL